MAQNFEEAAKKLDIRALLVSSVITALAFVVGLTWNEAIKQTIAQIVPTGESLFYSYLAAVAVTFMAVTVAYFLYRSQEVKIHNLERLLRNRQLERFANQQTLLRSIELMRVAKKEKERLRRALIKDEL
ncbi:MAG: hypothetical protein HYY37_06755 [Candidatus Aenigmarchaeota archaeon]|nr:hypothetical protein [Candidatus Aenigmarchaeota archaeon]